MISPQILFYNFKLDRKCFGGYLGVNEARIRYFRSGARDRLNIWNSFLQPGIDQVFTLLQ